MPQSARFLLSGLVIVWSLAMYGKAAEAQRGPVGSPCYVCGSYDGGPGQCFPNQSDGMSACGNPCFGTFYDCSIV